jgi:hypothetical protein
LIFCVSFFFFHIFLFSSPFSYFSLKGHWPIFPPLSEEGGGYFPIYTSKRCSDTMFLVFGDRLVYRIHEFDFYIQNKYRGTRYSKVSSIFFIGYTKIFFSL